MAPDDPVPRAFGLYKLLRVLGRGTSGIIYQGLWPKHDRIFALKSPLDKSPTGIARFAREARAQGALRMPGIPQIYLVGQIDGEAYLGREYVEGTDLAARLQSKASSLTGLLAAMSAVARTVAAIHECGIIHRQIDASNILIAENGSVKLIGFGRAKARDPETAHSLVPDIQGIGQTLEASAHQLCQPLPEVVEAITMKCQAAGSAWGYQSAGEVADAIDRYLGQ